MDINDFVVKFTEQFDETDPSMIHVDTIFRDLEEWSSLMALSIISMIDEEYDVALRGDDLRNAKTIEDLFNIVKAKK